MRTLFHHSRFLFYAFLVIIIINLSSCESPHFYRPRSLEPVLLSHKKQLTVNIIGDEIGALSIAYSPVSNFGIHAGLGEKSGKDNGNEESYLNPYVSAGYFKNISTNGLIELYGGAGIYNYKNKIDVPVKSINFSNFFIQPSFALLYKNIDVAFTIRGDYFKRNKTITNTANPPDTSFFQYTFLKYSNYYFMQPGVTVRVGIKSVKFLLQVSKSYALNNKYNSIYGLEYSSYYNTDIVDNKANLAIGIMVDFEDILRQKK
jgi:hypothetical protein